MKHSNLLGKFVSSEENEVLGIWSQDRIPQLQPQTSHRFWRKNFWRENFWRVNLRAIFSMSQFWRTLAHTRATSPNLIHINQGTLTEGFVNTGPV